MSKTKLMVFVSLALLLIAVPLLGACTKEVPVERIVEKEVIKEVPVEKVVEKAMPKVVLGEEVGEPQWELHFVGGAYPHPFWTVMENGATHAGQDFNVKVVFHVQPEHSIEEQMNRLEQVRALKPDGVVIHVNDVAATDGPARRVIADGIPIICANSADPRPEGERIPYLFYVGQHEVLAGEALAKTVLKARPNPTRAALGMMLPGHVVFEARKQGIVNVLEERGIPFDMLDITLDPTTQQERMRGYFQNNPETDVWLMGHVDPSVEVAVEFFNETGREIGGEDGVLLMTVDVSETGIQAVRDGTLLGMIDQQIYLEGYLPVQWFYMYKKWGFLPAQDLLTGPTVVDKSNVDIVEASVKAGYRR